MLKTVLKRELLHNLYSLRFLVSLALLIGVFVAGSFSYIKAYALKLDKYRETQAQFLDKMKLQAGENATELAVNQRIYTLQAP